MDLSEYGLDEEVKQFLNKQEGFVIDRVSQEGGNCDIFFGEHEIFDRRIALKVYYAGANGLSDTEPKVLAKIDHPNILKVRNARRIGKVFSFFMTDEISGGDLEKYFGEHNLWLSEKLNIFHGVLNGLTELHNKKNSIVHRDIKPKNILFDNEKQMPLISDFGSIKRFDKTTGAVTGSKSTLIYTPKEAIEKNKYTIQSDLYQVGLSIFQLLGGFFPDVYADWLNEKERNKLSLLTGFEQSVYLDSIIHKLVIRNKLLRFDSLPPFISKKLIGFIKKATHPSLKIRFKNTGEMMNELYKIQKNLTDWKFDEGFYYAKKISGSEFRVRGTKKGYKTEKKGARNQWRRCFNESEELHEQIQFVEKAK